MSKTSAHASEAESRRVAEASREAEWKHPSFLKELFLGNFLLDLIDPFPAAAPERPRFREFFDDLKQFVEEHVDAVAIDATGEYPPALVDGLRRLGAFGMKIPEQYGGLGFSQAEYNVVMQYLGGIDGNVCALLSAHQSIGVPQPIKLFGTEEQKNEFLPRCAAGELSAFALTEPGVGSDPASLKTTAVATDDGEHFLINGEKLWCTNGTLAKLLVVMACDPETRKISTFIVETDSPGVTVEHRCRFMGLRALANAVVTFDDVKVPKKNLIGKLGQGLKIALVTLNTGRLTLPATCLGGSKACLELTRRWANVRNQWGLPIGRHEAIAHKLTDMAAAVHTMEAIEALAVRFADSGRYDIRLEAAAAKEWNTTRTWKVVDDTLQIRGGRGYETESSLAARGEAPVPVERLLRDARINTLFEGSSEIMHLFMAREAVDEHLQVAGAMIDPKKTWGQKLKALPGIAAFYVPWYLKQWLSWGFWPRYEDRYGRHARHLRFVNRRTRRLARNLFHAMVRFGPKMERKQAFLFRVVDVGLELFAMATSVSYARSLAKQSSPQAESAAHMADVFCRDAARRVDQWFRDLWNNDDDLKYRTARAILDGEHALLEEGIRRLPFSDAEIAPKELERKPRSEPVPTEEPAEAEAEEEEESEAAVAAV